VGSISFKYIFFFEILKIGNFVIEESNFEVSFLSHLATPKPHKGGSELRVLWYQLLSIYI